jgi:hypothetical protein
MSETYAPGDRVTIDAVHFRHRETGSVKRVYDDIGGRCAYTVGVTCDSDGIAYAFKPSELERNRDERTGNTRTAGADGV